VKKKIIHDKATWQAIGERVISADLMRDDIDHFIIDELGGYRSARTKKWRTLKAAIKPKMWAWGLTGTPTPERAERRVGAVQPHHAVDRADYFTSFKQMTMQKLTEHIWVPLDNAPEIVHRVMQPSIRFERDQCYDLPPCTYSSREVSSPTSRRSHYKAIAKELYTEINGGKIVRRQRGCQGWASSSRSRAAWSSTTRGTRASWTASRG
jgi:hypothetical protein